MDYNSVRVITGPTVEPVTAAECKLDARVDGRLHDHQPAQQERDAVRPQEARAVEEDRHRALDRT